MERSGFYCSHKYILYILKTTNFCFVPAAPIGDKTRKPKLLKPQPKKLVLVSTIHDHLEDACLHCHFLYCCQVTRHLQSFCLFLCFCNLNVHVVYSTLGKTSSTDAIVVIMLYNQHVLHYIIQECL